MNDEPQPPADAGDVDLSQPAADMFEQDRQRDLRILGQLEGMGVPEAGILAAQLSALEGASLTDAAKFNSDERAKLSSEYSEAQKHLEILSLTAESVAAISRVEAALRLKGPDDPATRQAIDYANQFLDGVRGFDENSAKIPGHIFSALETLLQEAQTSPPPPA